jgi:hypothetical protein
MNTNNELLAIEESYWVIPGRFRAGAFPGALNDGETRQKLSWLITQGTNLFVDLTGEGESSLKPYVHLLDNEGINTCKVAHKRFPLKDFSTPAYKILVEILDTLDLALSLGRNVYLHCVGGKGRTGTVVGCYLVRHGLDGKQALERIQALRTAVPGWNDPSPETEGQRRMVMEWKLGW